MAARRGAAAVLAGLLLVSVVTAGVGVVAAAPGDGSLDGGVDDNTTDTTDDTTDTTDDTVDNTTDDTTDSVDETTDNTTESADETTDNTTDDSTDTVDNTTDATEDSTDDTTDTTDDATDDTAVADSTDDATTDGEESTTDTTTTEDGTDGVETVGTDSDTTNESLANGTLSGDGTDALTGGTSGSGLVVDPTVTGVTGTLAGVTAWTTDTLDDTTDALDGTSDALDGTSDALSGTLSVTTDSTVRDVLATGTTTEQESDTGGVESGGSGGESTGDATQRESDGWTRQVHRSAAGSVATAESASGPGEADSPTAPGAPNGHLPLPDRTATATAFVAGLVAIARPPVVTQSGASQTGTAAAKRVSAGFDRLRRFLVPLRYSRYDDSDPLDHEARAELYDAIEAHPGVYLSELSERAGVNISTARHHVRVLEDERLVTSVKPHGKRRYYPATADDHELAAALSEPATAAVLDALADLGTAHVGLLAEELDRDPSTVSHHLQRLADDGLVVRERDGRAVVNRLADPVADTVAGRRDHRPAVADD